MLLLAQQLSKTSSFRFVTKYKVWLGIYYQYGTETNIKLRELHFTSLRPQPFPVRSVCVLPTLIHFNINPTQQTWQKQTKLYNVRIAVRTVCGEPNDCQKQQNFGTLV
jgi:hypothetical protein